MVKVPLKRVPSEQKLQPPKRVSSVGPSQRRDNCQKLIEHYKAHPVKVGVNLKGLENNGRPPVPPLSNKHEKPKYYLPGPSGTPANKGEGKEIPKRKPSWKG